MRGQQKCRELILVCQSVRETFFDKWGWLVMYCISLSFSVQKKVKSYSKPAIATPFLSLQANSNIFLRVMHAWTLCIILMGMVRHDMCKTVGMYVVVCETDLGACMEGVNAETMDHTSVKGNFLQRKRKTKNIA